MPKLWKKTGDAKNNSDIVEVDPAQLAISKPTIVYFPGQITPDDAHDEISRNLNDVKKIFCDLPEPPQVYLWSHPEDTRTTRALAPIFCTAVNKLSLGKVNPPTKGSDLTSLSRYLAYKLSFHRSSTVAAENLAQNLIMPLATNAEGKPLPFDEAQKNLRNLTFMGYCIGGFAVQAVYNAAQKMLRKAGYSRKEARALLQEIVLVTIGTFSEPKKEENRYTTVSFIYNDDSMTGAKDKVFHPLHRAFSRSNQRLQVSKLSDSSIIVSGAIMGKKGDQSQEEVIEGVLLPAWRKGAFNHFFADYVNTNDNTHQFSRIVQYALTNAVNRNGTVKPGDLLKAPAALEKTPEVARYERKITQAMK